MVVHDNAEDVNKIMMLMQSLTVFMYFMLEPLLCASCCIFSSSLRSSGYEVLHGCAMPEVQGVRESVSTGFQKAWHLLYFRATFSTSMICGRRSAWF